MPRAWAGAASRNGVQCPRLLGRSYQSRLGDNSWRGGIPAIRAVYFVITDDIRWIAPSSSLIQPHASSASATAAKLTQPRGRMKLPPMEKRTPYLLARNLLVLNPPARYRLVDDPPPPYLRMPTPAPASPTPLRPRSRV